MTTPFDVIVEQIRKRGFHNQRQQEHSDAIGRGMLEDLRGLCPPLRRDLDSGVIRFWLNRRLGRADAKLICSLASLARAASRTSTNYESASRINPS
jgi:hypothetical protein